MEQIKLYSVYEERNGDAERSIYLLGTYEKKEDALKRLRSRAVETGEYYENSYGNEYKRTAIGNDYVEYHIDWGFDETSLSIEENFLNAPCEIML